MNENAFDPLAFVQLKENLMNNIDGLAKGGVRMFSDFLLFRRGDSVGAAIETPGYINIHNVHPGRSFTLEGDSALPGVNGDYLTFTCDVRETDLGDPVKREAFVNMILFFISRQNGNRERLLENPWKWAERVIEMTGDKVSVKRPYPYVAELYLVRRLVEAGLMTDVASEYRGPDAGRHDFELPMMSLEAKSHLHGAEDDKEGELVISSETQLSLTAGKPLYVVYFRMEECGDLSFKSLADTLDQFIGGVFPSGIT